MIAAMRAPAAVAVPTRRAGASTMRTIAVLSMIRKRSRSGRRSPPARIAALNDEEPGCLRIYLRERMSNHDITRNTYATIIMASSILLSYATYGPKPPDEGDFANDHVRAHICSLIARHIDAPTLELLTRGQQHVTAMHCACYRSERHGPFTPSHC